MSKNRQTVLGWVFILFLLFLWASPAWGTVYKWKDENGSMHFTDNITKVPPEFRPHYTNKKPRSKKKTEKPKTSADQNFKQRDAALGQRMEQGTRPMYGEVSPEQMGEELARELERSMEQLAEELGKVFKSAGKEYEH